MKKILSLCCLAVCSVGAFAQMDSVVMKYANTITAADLEKHLNILASDEYEGRETGLPGQKKAAEYISNYFASLGIAPCVNGSYYQEFPLKRIKSLGSTSSVNGKEWTFMDDFFFFPGFDQTQVAGEEIVFLGFGIEDEKYSDYKNLNEADVRGKVLMVMEGEPYDKSGRSVITGTETMSQWSGDWREKRELAQRKGAAGLIVVKSGYKTYLSRVRYYLENPGMRLAYEEQRGEEVIPTFFVNADMADALLANFKYTAEKAKARILKKGKPVSGTVPCSFKFTIDRDQENFTAVNVLAFIPGSDAELRHEIVVVTAHYDHVGVQNGEVYNGADDDGSGTVTALEIAQAFKMAADEGNGPRRSVLVMTVSGEEKGLLGSEWYAEFPIFPLENTVCDLNIDMIGRIDDDHKDNEKYVYLIGSDKLSTELHAISEQANTIYTGLELDYTYNSPDDPNRFYYRSDHYNFAKNEIPVIFYFSGVHEDYHQPGDDVEKIMFEKTAEIGKLVFCTAWEVANRDKKLVVDVENEFQSK